MAATRDIETLEDIKRVVDLFYARVRKDDLIGPIFNEKLKGHWPEHLAKLYSFWQSVLLGVQTYEGFAFPPHAQLPIHQEHFDRWLLLFSKTVSELYIGEKADEAVYRAYKIADVFKDNLRHIRSQQDEVGI